MPSPRGTSIASTPIMIDHTEFLGLIQNAWRVVWLAAHVERSLKREDFEGCALRAIVDQIVERRKQMTLRQHGHLVLGAARVLLKRFLLLNESMDKILGEMESSRQHGCSDEMLWEDDGFYDMEFVQQGRQRQL